MSAVADIKPGVAFAVSQLRRLAEDALREQPTDQTRHLCLTDAAQRLERAALQQDAARRGDLFTSHQPTKAAE